MRETGGGRRQRLNDKGGIERPGREKTGPKRMRETKGGTDLLAGLELLKVVAARGHVGLGRVKALGEVLFDHRTILGQL